MGGEVKSRGSCAPHCAGSPWNVCSCSPPRSNPTEAWKEKLRLRSRGGGLPRTHLCPASKSAMKTRSAVLPLACPPGCLPGSPGAFSVLAHAPHARRTHVGLCPGGRGCPRESVCRRSKRFSASEFCRFAGSGPCSPKQSDARSEAADLLCCPREPLLISKSGFTRPSYRHCRSTPWLCSGRAPTPAPSVSCPPPRNSAVIDAGEEGGGIRRA
mmetsp:Transcript_47323/g.112413  ORF Transcript_47323/g.112413 Transcript_47323/m.112413 type:complete len:213 (+) Transcript_47323:498-1136(+)